MSGHSKWHSIKHAKGAADAARGKAFARLARQIEVAARDGGGDVDANPTLRTMVQKARDASMPKDNIERAIKRGTGETEGQVFEELTYEGYGPGGVAVLVDILTDNRNRTNGEVRKIFERSGGKMGSSGNVAFLFERKGLIAVESAGVDEDALMAVALEAGAEDMTSDGGVFGVTTDAASFAKVKEAVEAAGFKVASAEVSQVAKAPREVDEETGKKVARLMEMLDDHDDVQKVYTDANLTEAMMAE